MSVNYKGNLRGEGMRMAVVVSRFNQLVTDRLLSGALDALERHGVDSASVAVAEVPGSFELPVVARRLADSGEFDAVICLGAIIRGSTSHYDHVAAGATSGIAAASQATGVPVIFGVLTTENTEQALDRAGVKSGNKGWEAATTAIEMVDLLRQLPKAVNPAEGPR